MANKTVGWNTSKKKVGWNTKPAKPSKPKFKGKAKPTMKRFKKKMTK